MARAARLMRDAANALDAKDQEIKRLKAEIELLKNPPSLAECKPDRWVYHPGGSFWARYSPSLEAQVAVVWGKWNGMWTVWHWTVGHPKSMGATASGRNRVLQTSLDEADAALEKAYV